MVCAQPSSCTRDCANCDAPGFVAWAASVPWCRQSEGTTSHHFARSGHCESLWRHARQVRAIRTCYDQRKLGGTGWITYLAKPTSLLTPEGASRQILVETAWYGMKCLDKSCMTSAETTHVHVCPYRFIPVNWYTSAVDVCWASVFKILESRVAGFLRWLVWLQQHTDATYLCIACLKAEMEEAPDAILSCGRWVVHDKAKAEGISPWDQHRANQTLTPCTCQCPGQW